MIDNAYDEQHLEYALNKCLKKSASENKKYFLLFCNRKYNIFTTIN